MTRHIGSENAPPEPDSRLEEVASRHYLGDKGAEYHRAYMDVCEARADLSIDTLAWHLDPSDSILDFGCADGSLLASLPNAEKVGIEVNPSSRRIATERGLTVHETLAAQESDSIDVAISSHVLEHTLRPLDELIELRRVLKPRGKLVLILPIDDWRVQKSWNLPDLDHHLYTWTPQLLANLLSEAGFEAARIDVLTFTLPGRFTGRLYAVLPRRLFDLTGRATALLRRRRQLTAVATVPGEPDISPDLPGSLRQS